MTTATNKPLFSGEKFVAGEAAPRPARWFIRRMRAVHAQQLLELVRIVDDALNNTSLILLFTVGDTKLLFPGDAQIENWQYALKLSERSEQIVKKLQTVDVYKVGHHGSLNATPKRLLWEDFKHRNKSGSQRLVTLLSTLPGKHGRVANKTEVPRRPLLDALKAETKLSNTNDLAFGKTPTFCYLVEITP